MSRQVTMFQGSGSVTELKSDELFKLIRMRMQQNQGSWVKWGKVKRFFIFDLFCGEGVNIVDDKTVLGSPLCALNALRSCKLVDVVEEVGLYLSDVRPEAIDMLNAEIESNYIPDNAKVHLQNIEAKGALSQITNFLSRQEDYHAILILDPNGPAQIPLEELDAFSQLHSDNSDVILNFNVTAFKRVFGHRNGKGKDSYNGWWAGWVKDVDDFVSIDKTEGLTEAVADLDLSDASTKFISFEPLLEELELDIEATAKVIDWVIIGCESGNRKGRFVPTLSYISKLADSFSEHGTPVFLKPNVALSFPQEFPA